MKWIFVLGFFLFFQNIFGQEIGKTYTIKLKDGSIIYNAQIVEINKDVWVLNNSILGILQIDKEQIDSIITEKGKEIIVNREKLTRFTAINTQPERYIFLPSAFNLSKGEVNYQNILLLTSGYNYGITDNISIGTSLPTFILVPIPAISCHVKYSTPISERIRLGFQFDIGGAVLPLLVSNNFIESYGVFLPQAVVSFGDTRRHTSVHLGRADILGAERAGAFFTGLSYNTPISGKTFFVTQNMLVLNKEPVIVPYLGLRFVGKRKKGCLDVGLIGLINQMHPDNSGATLYFAFQRRLRGR